MAQADARLQEIAELGRARHRVQRGDVRALPDDVDADLVVGRGPRDDGRLDAELLAQQLRAAPRADGIVRAEHHRRDLSDDLLVAQDRLDAVSAEQTVAELEHDRVGLLVRQLVQQRARQRRRVPRGRRADAEVRKHRDVARARVLHRQDIAAQRDARGLERVDDQAVVAEAADDRARGRGLARVHTGAGDRDDGHAVRVERHVELQRLGGDARRHADALPQVREVEHAAQDLAAEWVAVRRIDGVADADDAAQVQKLHGIAGRKLRRQVARVAEQRLAVPERADDDVALFDFGHAAARQLDRVVARLVVEHLDGDQYAFLARNVRAHANLLAEIRLNGDRRDFVYEYRAHLTALRPGCGTCRAKP